MIYTAWNRHRPERFLKKTSLLMCFSVIFFTLYPVSYGLCHSVEMKKPNTDSLVLKKKPVTTSAPAIALKWVIAFFQSYISPMDGPRCQLYPTCSGYGKKAISRNGAVVGFWMTADRLMRDNSGVAENYRIVKVGEHYYYSDPVEDNEFLFGKKK